MVFGAVRADVGSISQTDYGYTGQRNLDSGIGLMDYKARFYSPYINRFIQPDTIIPDLANPQAYNRYSYVYVNPLRYVDPSGHNPRCGPDGIHCGVDPTQATTGSLLGPQWNNNSGSASSSGGGNSGLSDGNATIPLMDGTSNINTPPSAIATMATVLDTIAMTFNGGYALVGDLVFLACQGCYPYVVGAYHYYSYIPNTISTMAMAFWIMDGVDTGENSFTIAQTTQGTTISVSISQDTIVAIGTNIAGWTVLKEPNVAFAVDAAVAGYDYARLGAIPFTDYKLPAWINPTIVYNTISGWDFSW